MTSVDKFVALSTLSNAGDRSPVIVFIRPHSSSGWLMNRENETELAKWRKLGDIEKSMLAIWCQLASMQLNLVALLAFSHSGEELVFRPARSGGWHFTTPPINSLSTGEVGPALERLFCS